MKISEKIKELWKNPEFLKLHEIGGHLEYHLEGDALRHTELVVEEAKKIWNPESPMILVAALHDIGKIYSSVCHGPGNWEYPGHAQAGVDNLGKFINPDDPLYPTLAWFIGNHIKPLFWKHSKNLERDFAKILPGPGELCTVKNLALLALCDVRGSIAREKNPALRWLEEFTRNN